MFFQNMLLLFSFSDSIFCFHDSIFVVVILFLKLWFYFRYCVFVYIILREVIRVCTHLFMSRCVLGRQLNSFREEWEAMCSWTVCLLQPYVFSVLWPGQRVSSFCWACGCGRGGTCAVLSAVVCGRVASVHLWTSPQQSGRAYRPRRLARYTRM